MTKANLLDAADGLIRTSYGAWTPGPDTPPDDSTINGRRAEDWERERIRAARLAQRAACSSVLDGVTRERK